MADVDGDARADLCARDAAGFSCFSSTGTGFSATPIDGPRWANAHGWLQQRFSGTLMTSGYLRCRPGPEVCDGVDNDCNGVLDDGDVCKTPYAVQTPIGDALDPNDPATVDVDAPLRPRDGNDTLAYAGGCTQTASSAPAAALGALLVALGTPRRQRRRRR